MPVLDKRLRLPDGSPNPQFGKYKKQLLVSFSGGRTSAYMLWYIWNEWPQRDDYEIVVVFANTGKEAAGTLLFVDECAQEWNIPIIWVEGYPKNKGKGWGVNHVVVDYESASRNGEPFEAMIKRLGIPSTNAPFCSDQLKAKAIESLLRHMGWKNYYKAIGIRADEPDRLGANAERERIIYVLVHDNPKTVNDVLGWWKEQDFDLDIHPDDGNCGNCWKKPIKLLLRNAIRNPKSFDWWQWMTDDYGWFNPRGSELSPPFNFFRENRSPADLLALATASVEKINKVALLEEVSGCATSCEAFGSKF